MILRVGRNSKRFQSSKVPKFQGFTLVELLAAVAVIAVGMVFILSAFSQCMSSLVLAQKMVTANYLLNGKIWEIDLAHKVNNGSEEGEWSGTFVSPNEEFNWTQIVQPVSTDFGQETSFVQENLHEEILKIAWSQGKVSKDISVTRYVHKKRE